MTLNLNHGFMMLHADRLIKGHRWIYNYGSAVSITDQDLLLYLTARGIQFIDLSQISRDGRGWSGDSQVLVRSQQSNTIVHFLASEDSVYYVTCKLEIHHCERPQIHRTPNQLLQERAELDSDGHEVSRRRDHPAGASHQQERTAESQVVRFQSRRDS